MSFIGGKSLSAEGAPLSAGVRSEGAVPPRNPIATRYDENAMLGAVTQAQFAANFPHENGKFWALDCDDEGLAGLPPVAR